MSNRIAIVGRMHSGKTTLAESLVEKGFTRYAFADPVKEISGKMLSLFGYEVNERLGLSEIYEWTRHTDFYDLEQMNSMKGHPSIRKLLQLVGTELGRNWRGPDTLWIDLLKIRVTTDNPEKVINDDCRFVNEGKALRDIGFTIIKLHRDEAKRVESIQATLKKANPDKTARERDILLTDMLNHPSETEIDDIDYDYEVESFNVKTLQNDIASTLAKDPHKLMSLYNSLYLRNVRDPQMKLDYEAESLSPAKVTYAHG